MHKAIEDGDPPIVVNNTRVMGYLTHVFDALELTFAPC
jgi:hypothetical protein